MTFLTKATTLAILIFLSIHGLAQPTGYDFGKQILIQSSQVSGTANLSNFVVLVSFTDPDLRSAANGGHVESIDGFDIIFTEPDCITMVDHQLEKYVPSTGQVVAWVKVPSLPATTDYGLHMYYGNSSITTDQSSAETWKSIYEAVWHMNDDPSSSLLIDHSGNGLEGEAFGGMTSTDVVPGKIGDAITFDGSNDYFAIASKFYATPNFLSEVSVSAWINTTYNATNAFRNWSILDFDRSEYFNVFIHADGRLGFSTRANALHDGYAGNAGDLNDGKWHHIVAVYNGTDKLYYINGSLALTIPNPHGGRGLGTGTTRYGFIGDGSEATTYNGNRNGIYYQGMYDEIHFTSRSLTSDWIQTEYNNQSIPATFYIKSAEYTSEDLCAILPIDLLSFSAKLDMPKVNLDWQTATEVNNDYFTIERSVDGETWKELKNIEGAGNSSTTQTYSTTDDQPVIGISYYRLKQTDFNGDFEYSKIISINIDLSDMNQIQVHPNPFINEITITGSESELERITLYNVFGQEVIHLTPAIEKIKNQLKLDMTNLSPGIYFLETTSTVKKIYKQ